MRQKMKVKWAKEEDLNSKLFFKVVNSRKRRNFIEELETEDESIITDQKIIEEEISSFCERLSLRSLRRDLF